MSQDETRDRIALQDLMLNYARAVDDRDRELYQSCFADDVEVLGFGTRSYQGVKDWADYVFSALDKYSATQHLLGPQLASIDGDNAHTRSDVQALHILEQGDIGPFILWATYHTDMRRIDGEWKISRHRLEVRATSSD